MNFTISKTQEFSQNKGAVYQIRLLNHGQMLVSAGSQGFTGLWSKEQKWKEINSLKLPETVYSLYYDKENCLILAGNSQGQIYLVDSKTGEVKSMINLSKAAIFSFIKQNNTEKYLAGTADGKIISFGMDKQSEQTENIGTGKVRCFLHDKAHHSILAVNAEGKIIVLDDSTLKKTDEFEVSKWSLNSLIFHPEGNYLLTAGRDARLYVLEWPSGKILEKLPVHNFGVYDLKIDPKLEILFTASRDKSIKVWRTHNLGFLAKMEAENYGGHTHSVNTLQTDTNRQILLSSGDDGRIVEWEYSFQNALQ